MGDRTAAADDRDVSPAGRPRAPLTVAVAQMHSHGGDVGGAVAEHVALLDDASAAGAQVVVFPELSLTGYEPDLVDLYQIRVPAESPALEPLSAKCRRHALHAFVGAPLPALDENGRPTGLPEVATLHVDPSGRIAHAYSKRRLALPEVGIFASGRAAGRLVLGGHRLVVSSAGEATGAQPAAEAVAGAEAYLAGGLFLLGAEQQQDAAMQHAAAAGLWVFLAQYCGGTGGGPACGRSGIWQPGGEIAQRLADKPGVVVAKIP
jgi:5-aminopentanamidase